MSKLNIMKEEVKTIDVYKFDDMYRVVDGKPMIKEDGVRYILRCSINIDQELLKHKTTKSQSEYE